MSCSTDIEPLQLSYANQTLTTDGRATSRGIAIQIGTPPQLFSLTPTSLINNTFLNNVATCGSDENTTCVQAIGGGYTSDASSTYKRTTSDAWNGSQEVQVDQFVNAASVYFNDILTVSSSETLPSFPLLSQTGSEWFAGLGLGQNSTFIDRLVETGYAPSHSWSLYAGVYSAKEAGSLVIGGYADRFYEGELYTQNVTSGFQYANISSALAAWEVTAMAYEEDGKTVNLLPDNKSLEVTVDPYYPVITVPQSMLYAWGNATNGTWSDNDQLYTYSSDSMPAGNVTVTLANGLKTTIPNKALFNPPAYDNGVLSAHRNRSDSTVYGTFTDWSFFGAQDTEAGLFGIPYVAMVYLIRDYERQTASIANANQAAQIGGDVTPICSLSTKKKGTSGSNTASIAGGVVGGVLGLALICGLIWFLLRRRKRNDTKQMYHTAAVETSGDDRKKPDIPSYASVEGDTESLIHGKGKLDGWAQEMSATHATQELPGSRRPPEEMPSNPRAVRSELQA